MPRWTRHFVVAIVGFVAPLGLPWSVLPAGAASAADPLPSLDAGDLGQGQFSLMHVLFQKTIFRINVATIDVRVDKPTQGRLAAMAGGKSYSPDLARQLATTVMGASRAVVQMKFTRDIPLKRWMGVVRDNLELARKSGLIAPDLEQRVSQGLPQWFAVLSDRGYVKGDRLLYSVAPDGLRTVVVSAGGQVLLDRIEREGGARQVVLPSYFAPGGEVTEPLLRSLFEPGH